MLPRPSYESNSLITSSLSIPIVRPDTYDPDGQDEFSGRPWWRKPSVFWMLPPYALYTIAFGGVIVPKLNLVLALICRQYNTEMNMALSETSPVWSQALPPLEECRIAPVQARVARFQLMMTIISGFLAAIASPRLGALSDRYGRTRVIVATNVGMMVGEILAILLASNPDRFSVYLLLIGSVFDGLTGSFTVAMALAHSYAADCTTPQKRNVAFGYFHGCLCMGIALGPLVASVLVRWAKGDIIPVLCASVIAHVIFILTLAFVVPESLSKSKQRAARLKYAVEKQLRRDKEREEDCVSRSLSVHTGTGVPRFLRQPDTASLWSFHTGWTRFWISCANSRLVVRVRRSVYRTFLAPLEIFCPSGSGVTAGLRRNLLVMAVLDTVLMGVAMSVLSIIVIYLNYMFGWDTVDTSIFMSAVNGTRVVSLVVGLPLLTRLFQKPGATTGPNGLEEDEEESVLSGAKTRPSGTTGFDISIIRVSLVVDALAFLGYGIAWTSPLFFFSGVLGGAGSMASPTLQSAMTKHVATDQVGQLLGATGVLHSVSRVLTPIVLNFLYAATIGKKGLSQTVFFLLSAVFLGTFVGSLLLRPNLPVPVDRSIESAEESRSGDRGEREGVEGVEHAEADTRTSPGLVGKEPAPVLVRVDAGEDASGTALGQHSLSSRVERDPEEVLISTSLE